VAKRTIFALCLAALVVTGSLVCLGVSAMGGRGEPAGVADSVVASTGVTAFGDSITCGGRTSNYPSPEKGYAYLLAKDAGGSYANWCVNGGQAADIARRWIYPKANAENGRNPWFTVMVGTNDVEVYGANKDQQQTFESSLAASIAWLAIPRRAKIFGQDAQVQARGEWRADDEVHAGLGRHSSTPGSSLVFALHTSGAPIYLAYRVADDNRATAAVSIDGKQAAVLAACGTKGGTKGARIRTALGDTESVALFRYPAATGFHEIRITVSDGGAGTGGFSFLWAGTAPPVEAAERPGVLVAGILRQKWDTKKELTEAYDGIVQRVVARLAGDGLPVHYVPVRQYVDATRDMDDYLHPNDAGHEHLRRAFESVMKAAGR
jgi:lysophospholipase L1-like esterase